MDHLYDAEILKRFYLRISFLNIVQTTVHWQFLSNLSHTFTGYEWVGLEMYCTSK